MRITNGIMMNNSLNNINKNKLLMDKLNTQIASTKKLSRPSDDRRDPGIASAFNRGGTYPVS